jgi:hypothetical protein
VHGLPSAQSSERHRWSQVGQPGGSHCSGKLTIESLHFGHGTRHPAGVFGAVHGAFVTLVKAGWICAPAVAGGGPFVR